MAIPFPISLIITYVLVKRIPESISYFYFWFTIWSQENSSTIMCSALLFEVINYYIYNSLLFTVYDYLDASKTFDRLCHIKPFEFVTKKK